MVQPRIRKSFDRIRPGVGAAREKGTIIGWILALFLGFGLLSGCASEPFIDGRREAGSTRPIGPSTPNRVAICYNSRTTTPEVIRQLAESECAKTDRIPRFDGQDMLECSWDNPTRVFFRCVAAQG